MRSSFALCVIVLSLTVAPYSNALSAPVQNLQDTEEQLLPGEQAKLEGFVSLMRVAAKAMRVGDSYIAPVRGNMSDSFDTPIVLSHTGAFEKPIEPDGSNPGSWEVQIWQLYTFTIPPRFLLEATPEHAEFVAVRMICRIKLKQFSEEAQQKPSPALTMEADACTCDFVGKDTCIMVHRQMAKMYGSLRFEDASDAELQRYIEEKLGIKLK